MRAFFILRCHRNQKEEFPSSEKISDLFNHFGWVEEEVNKMGNWEEKRKYYQEKSKIYFENAKELLPESVRFKESVNKVIFFGSVNKSDILVTQINQTECFVRIIHNELSKVEDTTEIVVRKIIKKKNIDNYQLSIAKDEIEIYERGHDLKIMRGKVIDKYPIFKILKLVKKQDKSNYFLGIIAFILLTISSLISYYYHKNPVEYKTDFLDKVVIGFIGVFITPLAKYIQLFFQIKNTEIVKWEAYNHRE